MEHLMLGRSFVCRENHFAFVLFLILHALFLFSDVYKPVACAMLMLFEQFK